MDALAELPPVDLESVNSTSQLLTRTDRKYVVPLPDLGALVSGVRGLRVLEIDDRRAFRYESTYFDTTDLTSWAGSAHPRRRRWKVRTRLYADTGEQWLEVKTRSGRGETVKERMPCHSSSSEELSAEATAWVGERLAGAGVRGVDAGGLVATLRTAYRRTTLLLPDGGGRATVDGDLHWSSASGSVGLDGALVVETKSPPGSAGPLDRRLWALGHRPVRISKYGTGLALLTPELPRNRWHRVVTRDLAPALSIRQELPHDV